jgi:hypothetical protein
LFYIIIFGSRLSDNAGDLIHEEYYITLSLDISNVMLRAVWKYP